MDTIEVQIQKFSYGNVQVLKQIQFTVPEGTFCVLLGQNGAGKSTLLRSINRLNDVTEGEITIEGVSLTKAGKKELPLCPFLKRFSSSTSSPSSASTHCSSRFERQMCASP